MWTMRRNKSDVEGLAKAVGINKITAKILANRGLVTPAQIREFLNVGEAFLYDTLEMKGVKKALEIVKETITKGERIAIYGDYDADGISSTVILYKALKKCGADVTYYIPNRESEGYGMNIDAVHILSEQRVNLIFTTDNGIAAIDEIKEAKRLGMKVVVLDHHEVRIDEAGNEILPDADTIIDPKMLSCNYPFKQMCAGGLAYKFVLELYKEYGFSVQEAEILLPYATIATICDLMDLVEENRVILKKGLELIKQTQEIGLRALLRSTELLNKDIGTYQIGFVLGPCINATGRLEHAKTAVELFITEDSEYAEKIAMNLVNLNAERKKMTETAVKKAIETVETKYKGDKVIVLYDEDVHESVAGIVAGKIKEIYYLPTIVLTKGEKYVKGSARSIEAYNMFEELCKCSELFEKFGGHQMAAGMTLRYENVDTLRDRLNQSCTLTKDDITPKIRIDAQVPFSEVTFELEKELALIGPFGKGNESPLLAEKNIEVMKIYFIGKEKKILRMQCKSEGKPMTALSFDGFENFNKIIVEGYGQQKFEEIQSKSVADIKLDMIYTININEYNGSTNLQIIIKDFRLSAVQ